MSATFPLLKSLAGTLEDEARLFLLQLRIRLSPDAPALYFISNFFFFCFLLMSLFCRSRRKFLADPVVPRLLPPPTPKMTRCSSSSSSIGGGSPMPWCRDDSDAAAAIKVATATKTEVARPIVGRPISAMLFGSPGFVALVTALVNQTVGVGCLACENRARLCAVFRCFRLSA